MRLLAQASIFIFSKPHQPRPRDTIYDNAILEIQLQTEESGALSCSIKVVIFQTEVHLTVQSKGIIIFRRCSVII